MFSVQSGASLAKTLFPILGVSGTTALRLGFAAIILCAIWRPWRGKKIQARERWLIAAYGAALGSMNLFFYLALERIPLGIAVAIEFIGPLGLAMLVSRKPIDFVWVLLAASGIFLILPHSTSVDALDFTGILFALIAGICWGFYIYFGQRAASSIKAGTITSLGMLMAALIGISAGAVQLQNHLVSLDILPKAILMALLSSVIPYSLEIIVLKKLSTQVFGIFMSLEPVVAAFCGFLFLKERLSFIQDFAIFLVILASVGVSLGATKKKISTITPIS